MEHGTITIEYMLFDNDNLENDDGLGVSHDLQVPEYGFHGVWIDRKASTRHDYLLRFLSG